jgi:hypothetical protein
MPENWGERYFDHYERFFNDLADRSVFEQDPYSPSIQVLSYDRVFPGCRVFASLGLSHDAEELGQVGEVMVPVDDGWADVPTLLANALFYMIQHRMPLGWGMAIDGIQNICRRFVRSHNKQALYLTNPFGLPEGFAEVECREAKGRVYLGFFISQSEFELFAEQGASQFEDLLESKGVDPCSLNRPSVV